MIKIYTGNKTSQQKYQSHIQNNYIRVENKEYISTCTETQRRIFKYMLSYRATEFFRLKRATIASACGCSIVTVKRALRKFHEDGVITKAQWNPYAPNEFKIHKSRAYTIEELIDFSLKTSRKKTCLSEYDPHAKYFVDLKRNPVNPEVPTRRILILEVKKGTKELEDTKKRGGLEHPQIKKREDMTKERVEMLETISKQLEMSERESLKLGAYTDEVLHEAIRKYWSELKRKSSKERVIRDKVAFFFSIANNVSQAKGIKPNFFAFLEAAKMLHIDLENKDAAHSHHIPPQISARPPRGRDEYVPGSVNTGLYKTWKEKPRLPINEEIDRINESIRNAEKVLTEGVFNAFLSREDWQGILNDEKRKLLLLQKEFALS